MGATSLSDMPVASNCERVKTAQSTKAPMHIAACTSFAHDFRKMQSFVDVWPNARDCIVVKPASPTRSAPATMAAMVSVSPAPSSGTADSAGGSASAATVQSRARGICTGCWLHCGCLALKLLAAARTGLHSWASTRLSSRPASMSLLVGARSVLPLLSFGCNWCKRRGLAKFPLYAPVCRIDTHDRAFLVCQADNWSKPALKTLVVVCCKRLVAFPQH